MKNNKLLATILLLCVSVAEAKKGPIQTSDIEQTKQQRQFNKEWFNYVIKDLQACVRMSNDISSNLNTTLSNYKNQVTEVQKKCHSYTVTTKEEFNHCVTSQYTLSAMIEGFIAYLKLSKEPCSHTQYSELSSKLKGLAEKLKSQTKKTSNKYLEFIKNQEAIQIAERRKKRHPESIKAGCHIGLLGYLEEMQWLSISALFSSDMGDMYDVEKSITIINIFKDDMITRTKLCDINERMANTNTIATAEEILKKTQSYKKPFEEMAKKICSYFDLSKPKHRELCQEPLNNGSWKYSAHQALEKQLAENREKRKKYLSQEKDK